MGPVLVAPMAQEGLVNTHPKKLHPFFSKDASNVPSSADASIGSPSTKHDLQDETPGDDSGSNDGRRKRRKAGGATPRQANGPGKRRGKKKTMGQPQPTVETVQNAPEPPNDESTEHAASDFPTPPLSDISSKPCDQPPQSNPNPDPLDVPTPAESRPKRVLKFNRKTGTLGSPPKPKPKMTPSLVVSVKFGHDEASRKNIGDRISRILDGSLKLPITPTKPSASRSIKTSKSGSKPDIPKTTHPFFTGKNSKPAPAAPVNATPQTQPLRKSVFMSTPMSPKKSRISFWTDKPPQFGVKPAGTKVPGAMQPQWPSRDMMHVRGFESPANCARHKMGCQVSRKSKGSVVTISPKESVVAQLCQDIDLNLVRRSLPRDPDTYAAIPKELRLPQRHFESGLKLQRRIRPQLRTLRLSSIEDDDRGSLDELSRRKSGWTHPAIGHLYDTLTNSLSAYDRSTCESQAWAQKYAPNTASQVLQAGREALLLKEWLQTLKVQSVDTGGDGAVKTKSNPEAGRKKRKKNKLDDFVVDSDEEDDAMSEVSENEDGWAPSGAGMLKKTVIRSKDTAAKASKDQGRLTNAVLISGPHGCGKTATVYAVAKELGFEIFEINSGSRRSGKDILEKVGDMTRNHLVQHSRPGQAGDEADDSVARDLKSGKQGMMTAFFKPKTGKISKPSTAPAQEKLPEASKSSTPSNQKQSLILLEEVDILYEEDKQFWASLMGLMAQSKRPFIMTCNDETLVPLQSLSLHGIFRFSHPPSNLAVDLCLLIAASEGHALHRSAVESLYRSRGHDLRATLTDLNYWCQIGVGDRRGGFDWFFLRWPRGSDLDENGDVVRVISEDTYREGMGWIGRDLITSGPNAFEAEEEVMQQTWDSWAQDLGNWRDSLDLKSWFEGVSGSLDARRTASLAAYDDFCGSMSNADIYSFGAFGKRFEERPDPTLPDIPTKTKDDFIIGRRLLEANPYVLQSCPHSAISISLASLAKHDLLNRTTAPNETPPACPLAPMTESTAISILNSSFDSPPNHMTRLDIAFAFDPIAVSDKAIAWSYLDPSVFDRTTKLIVLDVAPWVRSIVEFDNSLMQDRIKLSNLLSEGGKRKRMRNTRSAFSALEGGERRTTRRERYFGDVLNTELVRRTAGEGWRDAVMELSPKERGGTVSVPSSPPSEAS